MSQRASDLACLRPSLWTTIDTSEAWRWLIKRSGQWEHRKTGSLLFLDIYVRCFLQSWSLYIPREAYSSLFPFLSRPYHGYIIRRISQDFSFKDSYWHLSPSSLSCICIFLLNIFIQFFSPFCFFLHGHNLNIQLNRMLRKDLFVQNYKNRAKHNLCLLRGTISDVLIHVHRERLSRDF